MTGYRADRTIQHEQWRPPRATDSFHINVDSVTTEELSRCHAVSILLLCYWHARGFYYRRQSWLCDFVAMVIYQYLLMKASLR